MAELCEDEEAELSDSIGESIFDHESPMGLELDESADRWTRDEASATWTRSIVAPRKRFYHPNEGEGCPDLSTLSGKRSTLPSSGKTVRDNSKVTEIEDCPLDGKLWVGKCISHEIWEDATSPEEINRVGRNLDLPNGLVFTDAEEYSLTDDLLWTAIR